MKLTVNLNDFETFDRLLFNEDEMKLPEEERWKKFWDGESVVIPIPMRPDTVEEHQFCHYVYWMTIWAKKLIYKPPIMRRFGTGEGSEEGMRSLARCFACAYKIKVRGKCPIAEFDCRSSDSNCATKPGPYNEWFDHASVLAAYNVAHLIWEERDSCW